MSGVARERSVAAVIATVLVPFGVGYYLSYLFRSVNVVIAPRLAADIGLGAADLGFLTSVYFVTFAAFQLPLGLLLDRYGPRRVQAVLMLFAAAGAGLFAVAESLAALAVARGFIGLGVSGCLMVALKANVQWWPRERLALVNGFTVAFGSFGALSATVPVEIFLQYAGWRSIFTLLAVATLVVVVLTWVVVPEKSAEPRTDGAPPAGLAEQLRELGLVYGSGYFWRISILVFVHNSSFLAYQTLWMGPWLRDVAGMTPADVAGNLLLFNVGMFVGVLTIGALAERLQKIGVQPIVVVGTGITTSMCIQVLFAVEATGLSTVMCVAFGYFGSATLLVYTVLGQHFPSHIIGRANTAQNMLVFVAAFVSQWGIGAIIGLWPMVDGTRYDPAAHQAAFVVMIGLQLAAFIWFMWPRRRLDKAAAGMS